MNTISPRAFKYRAGDSATLERDVEALRTDYFYAALRSTLNDPFEGRFDRSTLDKQFEALESLLVATQSTTGESFASVTSAANQVLEFVDKCGILSLSQTPLNELIWAHYGGSHHGFCVEYDIEKLVEFEAAQYHSIEVNYSNAAPTFAASDLIGPGPLMAVLQKLLGTKSLPWEYESEIRVVTPVAGRHQYDYRAVKAIYFGLRCPNATRNRLMKELAGRGVLFKQVTSQASSYLLGAMDLVDPFPVEPQYLAKIAPIAEGAICSDYLTPEQKQHAGYLRKAAEIVRREPYCGEVQLVDFSGSKSTPDRPVIFVQYKRAENRWINHYLSLPEIDEQFGQLHLGQGAV